MRELAIRVEKIGKQYHIGGPRARYQTLRETLVQAVKSPFARTARMLRGNAYGASDLDEIIWALKDISFDVQAGEVVGIIGRNGAGKSTLLKILTRITEPTEGAAEVHGRVGSLLEVGTGFHPELTGRENIYLNGAVLGMHRSEIEAKFDEIVAFAELEKFVDTPVKFYSSGMYLRLAFAVAAHLEAEILLIDEVLAVGDVIFQKKCLGKMSDVAKTGRTVLFVSHQMNAINVLCSRCIWLSGGKIIDQGDPRVITANYLNNVNSLSDWSVINESSGIQNPYFTPLRISIVDRYLNPLTREISADESIGILIEGSTQKLNPALTVGFSLYTATGELLFWSLHTDVEPEKWPPINIGVNRLIAWIPAHLLNEGDYRVELMLSLHYQEWISQPGINAPSVTFQIRGGLSRSPYWMMARPGLLGPIIQFESIP
jgi:lipopolysaccharide transport system ATP-binding protein